MRDIRIATAQFENRNADKSYNFSVMEKLTRQAADQGAEVVSFHEICIPAYTFVRDFSKEQLLDLAEFVPDGQSTGRLIALAKEYGVFLLAGLLEKDEKDNIYNTYICVNGEGLVAKFRKLHAFINQHLPIL